MIIEKINIDYFGNITKRSFELSKGLNIIEGDNESGKSTVAAFIKFIFYGLSAKSRDGEINERERYINWNSGAAAGSLVVYTSKSRFRIERAMIVAGQKNEGGVIKKNYREAVQVIDLQNNSPIKLGISPGEYFFGVDEELFSGTSFVSQSGGTRINSGKLSGALENILFSDNNDISIEKALKKLDSARVYLLHKNGAGGKIYELETRCAELEEKLENAKKLGAQIFEAEASLNSSKLMLEEKTAEKNKLESELKAFENQTLQSLFEKEKNVREKLDAQKEITTEITEKYSVGEFFPSEEYVEELERTKHEYDKAKEKLEELERHAEAEKNAEAEKATQKPNKPYEEFVSHRDKRKLAGWLSLSLLIISLLFSGLGIAGLFFDAYPEIGKILLFSALFPLVSSIILLIARISEGKKIKELFSFYGAETDDDLARVFDTDSLDIFDKCDNDSRLKEAKDALLKRRMRIDELISRTAKENMSEALNFAREAVKLKGDSVAEEEKLRGMLEILTKQLEPYDRDSIMSYSVEDGALSDINADNINEKRRKYDFVKKSAEALEIRIHELEKKLASLYPLAENPARIAEKIELAREYIKEYRKKHAAHILAAEKICEASDGMRESIAPRLAEFTSELVSDITGGKYTEIGIDSELKVSFFADGMTRSSSSMSRGTQDAIYVALRLALIKVIYKDELPCVILDESFSSLDNTRLKAILALISGEKSGIQSIVLSSNSRECDIANGFCDFGHIKL